MVEVIKVPYPVETGKNIGRLLDFENKLPGIKLFGYPRGLAQALIKLGMVPGYEGVDVPGSLDNIAEALDSDTNVLLRTNIKGQQVPSRWYEYIEDRKDIVTGVLGDFFLGPLLNIAGYFLAGYSSDNKKEAELFIQQVRKAYPIKYEWVRDFYLNQISEKPKTFWQHVYKLKKNKKGKLEKIPDRMIVTQSNYETPMPNIDIGDICRYD